MWRNGGEINTSGNGVMLANNIVIMKAYQCESNI